MTVKARTPEDLRDQFMDSCRELVRYWSGLPNLPTEERLSGLLHSLLTLTDGQSSGFPCALDFVCRPHPGDKNYYVAEGEDWIEDGTVINGDVLLHELLYVKR